MSDPTTATNNTHDIDTESALVNEESVSKYLLNHPSFLIEHSDLLLEIQVALQENGVVSLTQIQTEQYREKIKQLKAQLEKLVTNARTNEFIYKTYAHLNLELAKINSFDEINILLEEYLLDRLGLEALNLVILSADNCNNKPLLSEIQRHSMFEKKLSSSPFYFGRLGKLEKETLFPNNEASSVAVIQIGDNTPIGLLVISSKNAMHFNPKMDTMLLEFLRQALNYHIPRLL